MSDRKIRSARPIKGVESAKSIKTKMDFKLFNKKITEVYKDEVSLDLRMGHSSLSRDYFNIKTKADLETLLVRAYGSPERAADVSKSLHALDPNYAKIISYYADMYFVRYTIIPVAIDQLEADGIATEEYQEKYTEMIQVVDGMNLEIVVPEILEDILLTGSAYIYADKLNSSKTISLLTLPGSYCRTVLKTNIGTNLIEFDMRYFEQFRGEAKESMLNLFPKEFRTLYTLYSSNTQLVWHALNPKFATSIMLNDLGMPPLLNAMSGIIEYEGFRANELTRSENQLKKILTHRIPIYEDELIFDLDEVKAIQKEITKIVRRHSGLETITVFGETELIQLQEDGKTENKQVAQAYNTIYNSAGINAQIFSSSTSEALKINQAVDQAFMWKLISKFNNFANVVVNNLYKFKPFQAEITILPVTIGREIEQIKNYRENANFGIGKLEAIVASGIKQKHLKDRFRLEQELDLDNILVPLASTHTQSGDGEDNDTGKNDSKTKETETEGKKNTSNKEEVK